MVDESILNNYTMKTITKETSIELILKDNTTVTLTAVDLIETNRVGLDMTAILNVKQNVCLLKIRHSKTNTLLDLTHVSPYALLFFNEKLEFCGASYRLNKLGTCYMLQTAYKTILFVKHPHNLKLNTLTKLSHDPY